MRKPACIRLVVALTAAMLAGCGPEISEAQLESRGQSAAALTAGSYWAYPVLVRSAVRDSSESGTSCGGNIKGYMYMNPGGEKAGSLPYAIGGESYDTCVYASNFQGPVNVGLCSESCPSSKRYQYEWSIDWGRFLCPGSCNGLSGCSECGSSDVYCSKKDYAERLADGYVYQTSTAKYPLRWLVQGVTSPTSFTSAFVGVMEHDPSAFAADDHVGGFNVNRLSCKYDVFDKGLSSGWTSVYRIPGSAYNSHQDIGYVDVKFWCYTCDGTTDCKYQVGAEKGCPTCGDGVCNGSETCSSCATDCGACSPPPSGGGSCAGMCGTSAGGCWCDTACESAGDCCPDYSMHCGGGSTCLVEPCPVF